MVIWPSFDPPPGAGPLPQPTIAMATSAPSDAARIFFTVTPHLSVAVVGRCGPVRHGVGPACGCDRRYSARMLALTRARCQRLPSGGVGAGPPPQVSAWPWQRCRSAGKYRSLVDKAVAWLTY